MTEDGTPAGLSSLRRAPLGEAAAEQLRERIAGGAWAVGDRLPAEPELAASLGVGRSTVREAVRVLVHAGLLETRQGSGTYLRARTAAGPWDARVRRAEVLEVYEVRQALESHAGALAARRRTAADLDLLDATLARRQELRAKGRDPRVDPLFVEADLAFHGAVVAAAHNPLLAEMYGWFTDALRGALAKLAADPEMAAFDVSDEHAELAAAIRAGDPAAAVAATHHNLDATATALRGLLDP
ncbi:MAG TPA: FCD domain-containing protein [Streptosporangiaceae bacterium]|jgi:DNA-binding FadR family transcriptional regulator